VKSEALSADVVQRYEEFGSRLLTEESDLYRKRLFHAVYLDLIRFNPVLTCENVSSTLEVY